MSLWFADAKANAFSNSPPDTASSRMLPLCLRNKAVEGVFSSVSTLARNRRIEQGTTYKMLFAPDNNTYVFVAFVGATQVYSEHGDYTWSLADDFRVSAGGGQGTSNSVLTLSAADSVDVVEHMCVATGQNVASISSALGLASFNVVVASI